MFRNGKHKTKIITTQFRLFRLVFLYLHTLQNIWCRIQISNKNSRSHRVRFLYTENAFSCDFTFFNYSFLYQNNNKA